MTDHFQRIYASQAAEYQRMIAAEDVDGNLKGAILAGLPDLNLPGKRVLDVGSGTGRLPLLLREFAPDMVVLDLSRHMLAEQRSLRENVRGTWSITQGDMRSLPFRGDSFDLVLAGWALGHLRTWFAPGWKEQIGRVLLEMQRVARPEGMLLIFETLTTGSLVPAPPTPGLAEYYAWLEESWGFQRQTIQTDYQFTSIEEAVQCTEFFFGAGLAEAIRRNCWVRLPEWTGVWKKVKD